MSQTRPSQPPTAPQFAPDRLPWLNLLRLELHARTMNAAVVALCRRFGFAEDGRLRDPLRERPP